jgi:hypothetical protein
MLDTSTIADGTHTLAASATDRAGNSASTGQTLIIDNTLPETTVTDGPTGTISQPSATFTWSGDDVLTPTANLVFAYRLDNGAFTAFGPDTSATFTNLAEAPHTFEVKARDLAGNEDPTPAQRTFTVTLSQVRVTITEPADGATVPAGQLLVRGTVESAGTEVGVTLNGFPAAVQGTAFAALVGVDTSITTLNAVATTANAGPTSPANSKDHDHPNTCEEVYARRLARAPVCGHST